MLKVVVIDGNALSRNLLTSVLDSGGYNVAGDSNPTSAGMAGMIKLQPQIVCIDIGTADEEGLARLDTLRGALPKALLFLVSGKFDPVTVETAVKRGVHGFIVKPFKPETVLKTIRNTVLKLAQQHRQANVAQDKETPPPKLRLIPKAGTCRIRSVADSGRPNRNPCATSQPALRKNSACSLFSTPSAVAFQPSLVAQSAIASVMATISLLVGTCLADETTGRS